MFNCHFCYHDSFLALGGCFVTHRMQRKKKACSACGSRRSLCACSSRMALTLLLLAASAGLALWASPLVFTQDRALARHSALRQPRKSTVSCVLCPHPSHITLLDIIFAAPNELPHPEGKTIFPEFTYFAAKNVCAAPMFRKKTFTFAAKTVMF